MKAETKAEVIQNIKNTTIKKSLLMLVSVCIMGMGVALLNMTSFGPDPYSALNYAVSGKIGMDFGTYQLIYNIVLLIIVLITKPQLLGLGTIGNMVLVGYMADFTTWIVRSVLKVPMELGFGARVGIMIPALVIFVCAAATYMNCELGTSPYDALSFFLHEKVEQLFNRKISFKIVRISYDGFMATLAFIIGGGIGVVTICMVILLGPAVDGISPIVKKWIS